MIPRSIAIERARPCDRAPHRLRDRHGAVLPDCCAFRQPRPVALTKCADLPGAELHSEQPRDPGDRLSRPGYRGGRAPRPPRATRIAARIRPPPSRRTGSRGTRATLRSTSGSRVHSSSAPETSEARTRPASQRRADAVAGVAERVVDPGRRNGADERHVVGRDVDRAAPRRLDLHVREGGQEPAKPFLCTPRSRRVVREALVDPRAEADRPGARAHQHAAVVRRAEVVQEHARVVDAKPSVQPISSSSSGTGSVSTT